MLRQHHGQHRKQRQRQHPRGRRGGAGGRVRRSGTWPRGRARPGPTRARSPASALGDSSPARTSPATASRARAHRERRARQDAAGRRHHGDHVAASATRDQRHQRPHRRGQHEQDEHGQHELHDLPGGRSHATARRPRPTSPHVAPVADAAVHVAEHPAGQREVEELRAVVGRDAPRAATAGRPGRGRRVVHRQAQQTVVTQRRCAAAAGVPASTVRDAVEEGAGAEPPDEDGQHRGAAQQARPPPPGPAHRRRRRTCSGSVPGTDRRRLRPAAGRARGDRQRAVVIGHAPAGRRGGR